jgi:carbon dioxide concentrating mechanism protein CcmN
MQNPLALIHTSNLMPAQVCDPIVCGDVDIDPTATIAAGVIIQAAANSRIEIGAGVCLGMGCMIKAYGGKVQIEAGVTLGAGVLIIGQVTIGAGACIGAATTIFNQSVAAGEMIATGLLLGDRGRELKSTDQPVKAMPVARINQIEQIDQEDSFNSSWPINDQARSSLLPELAATKTTFNEAKIIVSPLAINPPTYAPAIPASIEKLAVPAQIANAGNPNPGKNNEPATLHPALAQPHNPPHAQVEHPLASKPNPEPNIKHNGDDNSLQNGSKNGKVYGKAYVEEMLGTMLPHRKITQQWQDASSSNTFDPDKVSGAYNSNDPTNPGS